MSGLIKSRLIRNVFGAAALLGASALAANAQNYGMGGNGGNAGGSYGYIELDYPNGDSRRILFPYIFNSTDLTAAEKADFHKKITPILKDYVADILPLLSPQHPQAFAYFVATAAEMSGVDEMDFCQEIGFDYAYVEEMKRRGGVSYFASLQQELGTPYRRSGYAIVPSAMYVGEDTVDKYNELLHNLQVKFPNDASYQIPDMTYDILVQQRIMLADALADTLVNFYTDVSFGRIDMSMNDNDIREYLAMVTRILAEPENLDSYDVAYNAPMAEYLDEALGRKYAMTEDMRNRVYKQLFELRDRYDYRPLPHEADFLAGRDVIGAPKP